MPRSIRPKVPRNLRTSLPRILGRLSSSAPRRPFRPRPAPATSPVTTTTDPNEVASTTVDLGDPQRLYAPFSTRKLLRSSLTLQAASRESVADLGAWVLGSRAMNDPFLRRVVLGITERTFFNHFCAGKDLEEAGRTLRELRDAGLNAMLDYGLEHSGDNDSCDRNMSEFIRAIEWTESPDASGVSFVVLKITAICPPSLLRRVSDLLRWEFRHKSIHLPWKLRTLPIFTQSSPFYHTITKPEPLTPEEEHDLELAYQRLDTICLKALEVNARPLMIDAEDTSIQPAIDYFTYSAAIKYKLGDNEPLIFNTIQAYLKDSKERLINAQKAADRMRSPVGFKLVRGAYLTAENRLANDLGVKLPIHDGINDTHACYNACTDFMLHEVARGKGSVVLATHNVDSGKLAAATAHSLGIKRETPYVQFAQLYGMSDALSFGLRDAGFKVSKYLPFGPVEQIIPYLVRRAEENKGLLSTSTLDRSLMRKELLRRLTSRIS